jgi:hypothetical protein
MLHWAGHLFFLLGGCRFFFSTTDECILWRVKVHRQKQLGRGASCEELEEVVIIEGCMICVGAKARAGIGSGGLGTGT